MAFDYKKEYKEFYLPKKAPGLVCVPPMQYLAVRGVGDPNEVGGAYQAAMAVLYSVAYTIKMSKLGEHRMEGYFDFVVPPLEGFWVQPGKARFDYSNKAALHWTSAIRLPEFVTEAEFDWAVREAAQKKGIDTGCAELLRMEEGLCGQIMHVGSYDSEPESLALLEAFLEQEGYTPDLNETRRHHEIYLSDPRKVAPERLKTVIRIPVRRV